jgi:hypothetical protein
VALSLGIVCGACSASASKPAASGTNATPPGPTAAAATTTTIALPDLKAEALSISDMPTGWSVDNSSGSSGSGPDCLKPLQHPAASLERASASFQNGDLPNMDESLAYYATGEARNAYLRYVATLAACRQVTFKVSGHTLSGSMGEMSFPSVGDESRAYQINMSTSVSGVDFSVGIDVVVVRKGNVAMDLVLVDLGTPDTALLQQFSAKAVAKIGTGLA